MKMKKTILTFICFTLILVTSCGSDIKMDNANKINSLPKYMYADILREGTSVWTVGIASYEIIGDYISIHTGDGSYILVDKSNCVLYSFAQPVETSTVDIVGSSAVLSKIMYVNAEMVALYSDASLKNDPIAFLNRGDVVTLQEISGSLSKVITIENVTGYVVSSMLSDSDPTIGESLP
ncbi:MAG: SH3 domain-containing protein [Eubacteriales bacterium]